MENTLGLLEQEGARNLRALPEGERAGPRQDLGSREDTSGTTGRWIRYRNPMRFQDHPGRSVESERNVLDVSDRTYEQLLTMPSDLQIRPDEFKSRFTRDEQEVRERKVRNLTELILSGVENLPRKLRNKLQDITREDPESLGELLRYGHEILGNLSDAIHYKSRAGNEVNRLHNMLIEDDINAPLTYASIIRIKSKEHDADVTDWFRLFSAAAQVIQVPMKSGYGTRRDELLYAANHPVLQKHLDLDTEFKPLHWAKEIPFDYDIKTIREKLDEETITRAEAEGMNRALKSFWQARDDYIIQRFERYFGNDLQQAVDELGEVYQKEKAALSASGRQWDDAETQLSKQSHNFVKKVLKRLDFHLYEEKKTPRPKNIEDMSVKNITLKEADADIPKAFVELQRIRLMAEASEERREEIKNTNYTSIIDEDEAHDFSIKDIIDKTRNSYFTNNGRNTNGELEVFKQAGLSKQRRKFEAFRKAVEAIDQEASHGLLRKQYAGKAGHLLLKQFAQVVGDYTKIDKDLDAKIKFIGQIEEVLELNTEEVSAETGERNIIKKAHKFSVHNFTNMQYVSLEQRKVILTVHKTLVKILGFESTSDEEATEPLEAYHKVKENDMAIEKGEVINYRNSGSSLHPSKNRIARKWVTWDQKTGIHTANLKAYQEESKERDSFTPVPNGFEEKLKIIANNLPNNIWKDNVRDRYDAISGLYRDVKAEPQKVRVAPKLIDAVNHQYELTLKRVTPQ
jgi:hypothetical protein